MLLWERNEDDRIIQFIQIPHIAIHIILPLANGNEADIGISFMDKASELGNLLFDPRRENNSIYFERTNGIEDFDTKGFHYFDAAILVCDFSVG